MCLTYGERGESAKAWREGKSLEEIKAIRREEAEKRPPPRSAPRSASSTPATTRWCATPNWSTGWCSVYRDGQPDVVLTHPLDDPYNGDHPAAARMALDARVLAQAIGYPRRGEPLGAPPVFFFEPHQPEQCDFKPERAARHHRRLRRQAQGDGVPGRAAAPVGLLHRPRHAAAACRSSATPAPTSACRTDTMAEAYMRYYPQVTEELA